MTNTVGDRIKKLRNAAGFKQVEFAKLIGISQGNLSDIESSKFNPSIETIISICNALGVTSDWLLRGDVIEFKNNEKISISSDDLVKRILCSINNEVNKISEETSKSRSLINRIVYLQLMGIFNPNMTKNEIKLFDIFRRLKEEEKEELIRIASIIGDIVAFKKREVQ